MEFSMLFISNLFENRCIAQKFRFCCIQFDACQNTFKFSSNSSLNRKISIELWCILWGASYEKLHKTQLHWINTNRGCISFEWNLMTQVEDILSTKELVFVSHKKWYHWEKNGWNIEKKKCTNVKRHSLNDKLDAMD